MVESASINKSLFVLAQCVEAISKKHSRIPYRESKMTRILSLGQNNGLTIMILNLAPIRSYHLDTLSSLNFANRTKKIEVREVENEPIFKGPSRPALGSASVAGSTMQRQPLRPLAASVNVNLAPAATTGLSKPGENKPAKAFSVYSDKGPARRTSQTKRQEQTKHASPLKRRSDASSIPHARPTKSVRSTENEPQNINNLSASKIQEIVEKKVEEALAARELTEGGKHQSHELSEQVRKRLESLEQRIEGTEDARAEGLSYLLMARQHQSRGEHASALRMYHLAMPFFPNNDKLASKIASLTEKLKARLPASEPSVGKENEPIPEERERFGKRKHMKKENEEYREPEIDEHFSDDGLKVLASAKTAGSTCTISATDGSLDEKNQNAVCGNNHDTPRTRRILSIVNARDISQIRLLRGVGVKKAEAIADCLCEMDRLNNLDVENGDIGSQVYTLSELGRMKGVGMKTVETMRSGIEV